MKVTRRTLAKALVVAFVVNLVVMGAGAALAYEEAPPIPDRVVGPDGETIATGDDVQAGKVAFQQDGLMNHGSILGNGAYFGPDYTADALDLKTEAMREYYAEERYGGHRPCEDESGDQRPGDATEDDADDKGRRNTVCHQHGIYHRCTDRCKCTPKQILQAHHARQ